MLKQISKGVTVLRRFGEVLYLYINARSMQKQTCEIASKKEFSVLVNKIM